MMNLTSDLKHGLRVLLRTPLFTICTIAALAIGIGATTALFSVVHALLIRPLPTRMLTRWSSPGSTTCRAIARGT